MLSKTEISRNTSLSQRMWTKGEAKGKDISLTTLRNSRESIWGKLSSSHHTHTTQYYLVHFHLQSILILIESSVLYLPALFKLLPLCEETILVGIRFSELSDITSTTGHSVYVPFLFSMVRYLSSSCLSCCSQIHPLLSLSTFFICHYHFLAKHLHSCFFFSLTSLGLSLILNLLLLTLYFLMATAWLPSSPWRGNLHSLSPLPHFSFIMQLTGISFCAKQTEIALARVNNQRTCFNFYILEIKT